MSVYIVRDKDRLQELLNNSVRALWKNATCGEIETLKNQYRFRFYTNSIEGILDIYQKNDGTTTLRSIGKNIELGQKLKKLIEHTAYVETSDTKSYSTTVGTEWVETTVEYLKNICTKAGTGSYKCVRKNDKRRHMFVSSIGDKLTLTDYNNGRILVQGKPLFLYNEFLSLISCSPMVDMEDVINAARQFDVPSVSSVDIARSRLQKLMPTAYNGIIDDTIWKVFSPAMVLIDTDKDMEDYSYCVFPALRALEGYLKFLLDEKNILIDKEHGFGTVFFSDKSDNTKKCIRTKMIKKIADAAYEAAMLEIYKYFCENRHVIFHMNQILIDTKLIESKEEAVTTVHDVAELIERTYKNTHS